MKHKPFGQKMDNLIGDSSRKTVRTKKLITHRNKIIFYLFVLLRKVKGTYQILFPEIPEEIRGEMYNFIEDLGYQKMREHLRLEIFKENYIDFAHEYDLKNAYTYLKKKIVRKKNYSNF